MQMKNNNEIQFAIKKIYKKKTLKTKKNILLTNNKKSYKIILVKSNKKIYKIKRFNYII